MKFNFKKISAIATSALMVGMTAGAAAAANYPEPFVVDGAANVAIVYGTGTGIASTDSIQAGNIQTSLQSFMGTTGGTTTVTGGDSYKIEKTSTKFHLGDYIGNVSTSTLDEDQLPTLLARGKFVDSDNEEFDYTQKIKLNNDTIQLKMFNDNDYAKDEPTLGFKLDNNEYVLNYTLDFTDKPYFNKLATSTIPLMGKEYYVLSVASANDTITLLDSAASTVLTEGETTTIAGKTVSIEYIGSSEVKFNVGGEVTNSIAEAQTYKLTDGSYIGVKDILYNAKDTGVSKVEFSLGSGKLKIESGQKVEINDEDIKNVYGYIVADSTKLDDLVLEWKVDGETFVTADQELIMPGFEAVKFSFGGIDFPAEEVFTVEAGGNDYAVLNNFPLKNGEVDIPLVGKASGNANYTFIGSDTDELLLTSSGSTITFDGSSDSNDEMFLVTWNDGTEAESYLVKATSFDDPSSGSDTVDFEYNDGSGWTKKYDNVEQTDEISFGNAELTVTTLVSTTGSESVTLTAGTNVVFDELYSKEGLKVQMPYINDTQIIVTTADATTTCALGAADSEWPDLFQTNGVMSYSNILVKNATATANVTCAYNASTYQLVFTEENKDGDNAAGASFNITIGNSGSSNYYTSVTTVNNYSSTREKDDSDVYESWMYSPLATKFVEDDSGDQDSVTLTYHGGEAMANVFVTAPDATISGGDQISLGEVLVTDAEVGSVSDKNLIVVGGSCINSAAASLVGGAYCGAAFTEATGVGSGEFLIKSYDSTDLTSKKALLVAGYAAEDTVNAAVYLRTQAVNTDSAYKGTSSTTAEVIVA